MDDEPPPSQASSHFLLDPVNAAVLAAQEIRRRDALKRKGCLTTGCTELDRHVLLGGLERGCVVGISAEEEDFGLLLGLQTVARLLAGTVGETAPGENRPTAMIITTLAVTSLLPLLRSVLQAQVSETVGSAGNVKRCLERVSIARVFDIDGLWEALRELDPPSPEVEQPMLLPADSTRHDSLASTVAPPRDMTSKGKTEIQDSEDEGSSLSPASSDNSLPHSDAQQHPVVVHNNAKGPLRGERALPEIVLVTHMSALMSALFASREKTTAHTMVQLLSSHLQYLTRSPVHGSPAILLLNSTASSPASYSNQDDATAGPVYGRPPPPRPGRARAGRKPPDPTLRSIFNPPPVPAAPGLGAGSYAYEFGYADSPQSRRNKPSYGLIFSQMLDLHLLATRAPRGRADAEAVFAPESSSAAAGHVPNYVTIVEVLLDEIGVWEIQEEEAGLAGGSRQPRRSREQRWGAVRVDDTGARIINGFESAERKPVGRVRVVGGFGGPRV